MSESRFRETFGAASPNRPSNQVLRQKYDALPSTFLQTTAMLPGEQNLRYGERIKQVRKGERVEAILKVPPLPDVELLAFGKP